MCLFFKKKPHTFIPNKILNILSNTKKKNDDPLLYISNNLNQSKKFKKLKNENINKKIKLKINILDHLK
jgi:hypothetical protein